jgi:hypothetical protein
LNALGEYRLATGEQRSYLVALDALDMHAAVPAAPEQLRDASRVVLISLVAHGRQRRFNLTVLICVQS